MTPIYHLFQEHLFDVSDLQDREPVLISKCGSIEATFSYDPARSRMNITVHQARDIPTKDRGGANSTQIRLLLLPSKKVRHKTKIKVGDNPEFQETLSFKVPLSESIGYFMRSLICHVLCVLFVHQALVRPADGCADTEAPLAGPYPADARGPPSAPCSVGAGPTSWTTVPTGQLADGHTPPPKRTNPASRRPQRMGTRWPIPLLSTGKPLRGETPRIIIICPVLRESSHKFGKLQDTYSDHAGAWSSSRFSKDKSTQ